jgi:hypothetical protein
MLLHSPSSPKSPLKRISSPQRATSPKSQPRKLVSSKKISPEKKISPQRKSLPSPKKAVSLRFIPKKGKGALTNAETRVVSVSQFMRFLLNKAKKRALSPARHAISVTSLLKLIPIDIRNIYTYEPVKRPNRDKGVLSERGFRMKMRKRAVSDFIQMAGWFSKDGWNDPTYFAQDFLNIDHDEPRGGGYWKKRKDGSSVEFTQQAVRNMWKRAVKQAFDHYKYEYVGKTSFPIEDLETKLDNEPLPSEAMRNKATSDMMNDEIA